MSKNPIKRKNIPPSSSGIKATKVKSRLLSFSFKYYQDDHPKFNCEGKQEKYWLVLVKKLKDLSSWTQLDLIQNGNKTLRCHPIDWEDTTETSFGLKQEDDLVETPYQFSLSSNEHGRVHGFFIDETFYVVWLDPDHKLYSS